MIRRPPRSTRTDTLFPYTTLFRSGICPARHARGFNRISLIGLIADPLDPASEHAANLRARRNVHQDVDVRTAEWAVLPNPYPGKLASTLADPIAGELQKLARGGCGPEIGSAPV